jgi:hypothetical protein
MLTAFFWRQKPASSIANPAFIKMTRTEQNNRKIASKTIFNSSRLAGGSIPWAVAAVCQPIKIKAVRGMQPKKYRGTDGNLDLNDAINDLFLIELFG